MTYKLSICIPTYNRVKCLQELLDSIIIQAKDVGPVEICISDDVSTERTDALVREYQQQYPHIVYHRLHEHMGLDRNLLKAVELAHGEYCWLMGNDDKIEPHAISGILKRIEEYGKPTVLNVKGYLYDRDMKTKQLSQIRVGLRKSVLQQDTMFENIDEIVKLFGDSFGFLGDNLFRRDIWNEVVANTDLAPYYTCCYIHLAVLLMMLQKSPKFLYINQHCVGFRGNNDLFLEILGELRRLKLDVVGYDQVAAGVFSRKSHLYKAWMTRVMQFHIRSRVLAIKFNANSSQMSEVAELMFKYYKTLPGFWIHILPILLLPRNILLGLRACYRATIRRATPQI